MFGIFFKNKSDASYSKDYTAIRTFIATTNTKLEALGNALDAMDSILKNHMQEVSEFNKQKSISIKKKSRK